MKELETITDHAQLSQEQLTETFRSQGYLFIKEFFPKEDVLALRKIVTDVLVRRGWGKVSGEKLEPVEPFHQAASEEYYAFYAELQRHEEYHLWSYRKDLTALMEGLLGKEIFAHPRKTVRVSYPQASHTYEAVPAHQDAYNIRGEVDTFIAWTPLGNYTPSQGGVEVAHDSHRQGLFTLEEPAEGRGGGLYPKINDADFDWRVGHYEAGDLLLMHGMLLHRSLPNRDTKFRLSCDARFSSASGHINAEALTPGHYPYVPDWEELTEGWANPNLFAPPETLTVDAPLPSLLHIIQQLAELEKQESPQS